MLWYKQGKSAGSINFVYNQKFYTYSMHDSVLKEEEFSPLRTNNMVRVKAISVLQSGVSDCTIGVEDGTFSERATKLPPANVVQKLVFRKDYISWFARSFEVDGVSCVQGLFIYNEMTDINNILSQVGI